MRLSSKDLQALCSIAQNAALDAGKLIQSYAQSKLEVLTKPGSSEASQVLTEVDLRCEALILKHLETSIKQYDLALLSEEREDDGLRLEKDFFWCVDPLDGTLAFVESRPGYAVSIALVSKAGEALIGVVYDPCTATLYSAIKGQGCSKNSLAWQPLLSTPAQALCFPVDRSLRARADYPHLRQHLEDWSRDTGLNGLDESHHAGAVLNAIQVLERAPGCYFKPPKPQDGGGSLWDFAATACIVQEAGGVICDFSGQALQLNRPDTTFMNKSGVVVASQASLAQLVQTLLLSGA